MGASHGENHAQIAAEFLIKLEFIVQKLLPGVFSPHSSKTARTTQQFISSWDFFFAVPAWFSSVNHLRNIPLRQEYYPDFADGKLRNRLRLMGKYPIILVSRLSMESLLWQRFEHFYLITLPPTLSA